MSNDLGLCGNPVEDGKEGLWKPEGTRTPLENRVNDLGSWGLTRTGLQGQSGNFHGTHLYPLH